MSTATISRKSVRHAGKVEGVYGATIDDSSEILDVRASVPTVPTDPAPTLQDALGTPSADHPAPTVETLADTFGDIVAEFGRLISGQRNALVRFYIERGNVARRAINVKVGRSTDKATRASNRSSAVKALTMSAEINYDPTSEPKPKVDRWVSFSAFVEMFPRAADVKSAAVLDELVKTITRLDPPARWDDADTYVLKTRYTRDDVANLIDRTIVENMTHDHTADAIETIGGRVVADAPKVETADLTGAADAMAKKVMDAIVNKDIDGARFILTLQGSLVSYGYEMVQSHDDRGVTVYKLVKTGR